MERNLFFYEETCGISNDELVVFGKDLEPEIKCIYAALSQGYETEYASISLPSDEALRIQVKKIIEKKRKLKPSALVVIGIGGSNLGAKAVHETLYGLFYNEQQPDVKIYWADTVDSDYILDILLLVEQELQQGKAVLLNVISKSGKTTETIANFEIFLDMLRRYRPQDYQQHVVVTTDDDSPLCDFAQSEGFDRLSVPKNVVGRYSVLSALGLFPLGLIGVDIDQLHAGACDAVKMCTSSDFFKNPAALAAAILYGNYRRGKIIHTLFLFSVDLQSVGMWYRQLMAESLGKEYNKSGKQVNVGIMPDISIGSTDLHSMAQLYLGGPRTTFTTFVSVGTNRSNIPVPCLEKFEKLIAHIQCKPLSSIMNALFKGIEKAYKKKKLPFSGVILPEKNAYYIGQFLQWNMVMIMYLGYLLNINPFDQPEVELYKEETRKLLSHE